MKHEVGVYVTYYASVQIEADSEEKAVEVAKEQYLNCELIDPTEILETKFEVQ